MSIPRHFTGNAIMDALVRINIEADAAPIERALLEEHYPELVGLGTAVVFPEPANTDTPPADRAKGVPTARTETVQWDALHGQGGASIIPSGNRAKVSECAAFIGGQPDLSVGLCTVSSSHTVQPLSLDKKRENNGCTVVLFEHADGALRLASRDNALVSQPQARTARRDNEPCTTSLPAQVLQEVIPHPPGVDEEITAAPDPVPPASLSHLPAFEPRYLRCDFFDNGPPPAATTKGKKRSRYKARLFAGQNSTGAECYKLTFLSEPRYFKRSIPEGLDLTDPFYAEVWRALAALRKAAKGQETPCLIAPIIAHIKDDANHVIPRAAAILWQLDGCAPEITIYSGSSIHGIIMDKNPKGAAKCPALKAMGYRKNPRK